MGREGLQGEGLRVVRALKSLAASTRPILQHTGMYFRMPADGRWQGVQAICQRAVNRLILGDAQRRAFHEAGALAQHGILVRFMRQHKAMASAEALHRRVYSAAAWWIKKTLFSICRGGLGISQGIGYREVWLFGYLACRPLQALNTQWALNIQTGCESLRICLFG